MAESKRAEAVQEFLHAGGEALLGVRS